jgi:hypothetical protein
MGGGLMQLVAYGAQDIYLTGNPQITFFKVVYRRHTNFAVEAIEQTFNGAANFGQKFSCTISRNGDLLSRVYLETELQIKFYEENADDFLVSNKLGFDLINYVEVEIGGQCIDKHYGEWMSIWTDLTHAGDASALLTKMVGISSTHPAATSNVVTQDVKLYIPLQFWFCRNPGLALPLIALQYHEVKLNVLFNTSANAAANIKYHDESETTKLEAITLVTTTPTATAANEVEMVEVSNCCVFCDYIFLDTDERRRFAQVSHEYLIEQVQFSNTLQLNNNKGNLELRFNHPVKELFWTPDGADDWDTCLLQLNGHDRFKTRAGSYFSLVQRYEHHSGKGSLNTHMYSFALKPEEHQPSGTCNFSRIDNAVLNLEGSNADDVKVYAMNYNVLRIMSGMGGLAYSN